MRNINWGSWKTTVGGIIALLSGVLMLLKVLNKFLLNEPITFEEITIALTAIGGGFAGLTARDNNVSSQDVGIR